MMKSREVSHEISRACDLLAAANIVATNNVIDKESASVHRLSLLFLIITEHS